MISPRANMVPSSRRRAFSLAETVMATFLVGGLCVVAMDTAGAAISSGVRVADRSRALLLAQELLSEILLTEYSEPDLPTASLGRDPGERGGSRSSYDDVDDYAGWTSAPPEDRDGTIRPELAGWHRTVSVVWVDPANLSVVKTANTNIKRITVTVERDGLPLAVLTALKSVGLPPPDQQPIVFVVPTDVATPRPIAVACQMSLEARGLVVDRLGRGT